MSDTIDPDILFEIPKNKKMTLEEKLQLLNEGQGLTSVKKEKKKREITPEQREKMLQNLQKGRETRLQNKLKKVEQSDVKEADVKPKRTYKKKVVEDSVKNTNDTSYSDLKQSMTDALNNIRSEIQLLHSVIPPKEYIKIPRVNLEVVKQEPVKEEPVKEEPVKQEPVKQEPVKQEQAPIMKQPVIKQQPILKEPQKIIYAGNIKFNRMPWD